MCWKTPRLCASVYVFKMINLCAYFSLFATVEKLLIIVVLFLWLYQNDKRYLVLESIAEDRKKIILDYIKDLDRQGAPPPPTASEPSRRSAK